LKAEGHSIDISNEDQVINIIDTIAEKYKGIDMLVNAAAIVGPTSIPITAYSTLDFDRLYQINLKGAFMLTKYVIPKMEKRNYGRILLIASMAGKEGNPFMVGYSAMKAGIIGMVKAL